VVGRVEIVGIIECANVGVVEGTKLGANVGVVEGTKLGLLDG